MGRFRNVRSFSSIMIFLFFITVPAIAQTEKPILDVNIERERLYADYDRQKLKIFGEHGALNADGTVNKNAPGYKAACKKVGPLYGKMMDEAQDLGSRRSKINEKIYREADVDRPKTTGTDPRKGRGGFGDAEGTARSPRDYERTAKGFEDKNYHVERQHDYFKVKELDTVVHRPAGPADKVGSSAHDARIKAQTEGPETAGSARGQKKYQEQGGKFAEHDKMGSGLDSIKKIQESVNADAQTPWEKYQRDQVIAKETNRLREAAGLKEDANLAKVKKGIDPDLIPELKEPVKQTALHQTKNVWPELEKNHEKNIANLDEAISNAKTPDEARRLRAERQDILSRHEGTKSAILEKDGGKAFREVTGKELAAVEAERSVPSRQEGARNAVPETNKGKPLKESPGKNLGSDNPAPVSRGGISGKNIADGVGGALNIADLYVNYQACTEEGKSNTECMKEFTLAASQSALAAGAGGVAISTLTAMGVSAATISAVTTGLAVAGLPLALYGTYKTGQRWAEAPAVEAENRQKQQQKQLLPRFGEIANGVRTDIDALLALRVQSVGLCREISNQARSAVDVHKVAQSRLAQIKDLAPSIEKGVGRCDEARTITEEIKALVLKDKNLEEMIITDLDAAVAKAEKCGTRDDANTVRRTYSNCRNLSARLTTDAAIAQGKNNRLVAIKMEADRVTAALRTIEGVRGRMGADNARIHEIASSCISNIEKVKSLSSRYLSERAVVAGRIDSLSALLPETPPSPVYKEELESALNNIALLRNALSEIPDSLACVYGDGDPGAVTRMSLECENLLSEADTLFISARNSSMACGDVATAYPEVEAIGGSANWALSAVQMNESLVQKADACLAKLTTGKDTPGTAVKPQPSVPAPLAVRIGAPQHALQGRAIQLNSEITIDGVPVKSPEEYSYRWETSEGKTVTGKRTVTFTPKSPGRRAIRLTVTDAQGRSASASATVNIPKLLQVSADADKTKAASGEKVTVSASIIDEDEMCPCTYQWQADGVNQTFTSRSVWFKYNKPGQYMVNLNVKDRFGQTATASSAVMVKGDVAKSDQAPVTRIAQREKEEEETLRREREKSKAQDRIIEERLSREQAQRAEEERIRREQALREEQAQRRRERERQVDQDEFWGDLRNNPIARMQADIERERARYESERQQLAQEQERRERERENRLRAQGNASSGSGTKGSAQSRSKPVNPFCDSYAKNAVAQYRESLSRNCNYGGRRWHDSYEIHYNWCVDVSREFADSETKGRIKGLQECKPSPGRK